MKKQIISIGTDITRFTQIKQLNPIPSRTVIDKTLTGIGATYCEITSQRNSILILPNVATIIGKHEFHKERDNTFAVYEGVSSKDLVEYLKGSSPFKKILTTPEGFTKKVKSVLGASMYKDYFLLIDEAHKITTDAGYRPEIVLPMDDFFLFDHQAMISATVLIPDDERFDKKKFTHIEIKPNYPYQKPITVIKTFNPLNELLMHINNTPAEIYCIFFNSIQGIISTIEQMGKVGGLEMADQYKIHCSKESTKDLKSKGFVNVANSFTDCKKYNFFTSSFFNGLDIAIEAEVIVISDLKYAEHTAADPHTDVWQIAGRFRKHEKNITHIVKCDPKLPALNQEEVNERIHTSGKLYHLIEDFQFSTPNQLSKEVYADLLNRVSPYSRLLNKDKTLNAFKVANLHLQERIKGYYNQFGNLIAAYKNSKHFVATFIRHGYYDRNLETLKHAKGKYSPENYRMVTDMVWKTEGEPSAYHNRLIVTELYQYFPRIVKAYFKLGIEFLLDVCYIDKYVVQGLAVVEFIEGINKHPLIDAVQAEFNERVYTIPEIDSALQSIYHIYDIKEKVKTDDIGIWFEIETKNVFKKRQRAYRLLRPKLLSVYSRT